MTDERAGTTGGRLSRRTLLEMSVTGALAAGGLAGIAAGDGPDRRTENFEYREDDPNDYYVRESWGPPPRETPTVLMMDGYMGAGAYDHPVAPASRSPPTHYLKVRDDELIAVDVLADHPLLPDGWALAWGSIRGTGCSSGEFNLFDEKHALDGCEVIDWLGAQDWTNDRIGLFGASYSGITALHIASKYGRGRESGRWNGTLAALSANMIAGDLYRDVVFPGGVPNAIFPVAWTKGIRPAADAAGTFSGLEARDEICAQNLANRSAKNPSEDPVVWYTKRRDGPTWHSRSTIDDIDDIDVPTYISHAWQDEQSGPRAGVTVYDALDIPSASPPQSTDVEGTPPAFENPRLLRTTNGVHNTAGTLGILDARPWFEYWLEGNVVEGVTGLKMPDAIGDEPVVHHVGAVTTSLPGDRSGVSFGGNSHYTVAATDFPDPDTGWQRFHLDEGGDLLGPGEGPGSGTDSYVTGSPRQSWTFEAPEAGNEVLLAEGPDVLTYRSGAFGSATTVAGPINATLHVTSTAPEMDLFVRIADEFEDENGNTRVVPLQRGVLRASFRELDARPPEDPDGAVFSGRQTWYNGDGEIVRPYRPHTNIDPVAPGERYRYDVEVFPLAHTFRKGHRLVVRVHTPPASDGLWGYEPSRSPGVNVVHHDPESQDVAGNYVPSSLLVPTMDADISGSPVDYDTYAGYREMAGYTAAGTGSGVPDDGNDVRQRLPPGE